MTHIVEWTKMTKCDSNCTTEAVEFILIFVTYDKLINSMIARLDFSDLWGTNFRSCNHTNYG